MKKLMIAVASVALLAGLSTQALAASAKFGVINVEQILQTSSRVKALNASIRKQFQPEQATLAAQDKTIKADETKLQRNGAVMSADQKKTLSDTIAKDKKDFVSAASAFQQKLSMARNNAMKEVVSSLNGEIAKVAKAKGLSMVFFSQAVAYPGNAEDITSAVGTNFNNAK